MNWFPGDYVKSTFNIDFAALYQEGYRAVLFDIDNTLVPHGAHADERAIHFFQELHDLGFQTMLISNNKEPRVKSFSEEVKYTFYIYKAGKPSLKNYLRAMKLLGATAENTLFVGDQILTDIWGANRAGIRTVLVEPVLKWREEIQIILKRFAEAVILFFYRVYLRFGGVNQPLPLKSDRK